MSISEPWKTHLSETLAVRRRVPMYFPVDKGAVATQVLRELLCHGAEELALGRATRVQIEVTADGALVVEDDGVGVDGAPQPDGEPSVLERVALSLHAGCRHERALADVRERVCQASLAAAAALATSFVADSRVDGRHWRFELKDGVPVSPPVLVGPAATQGLRLEHRPDRGLVGDAPPDLDALRAWWDALGLAFVEGRLHIRRTPTAPDAG